MSSIVPSVGFVGLPQSRPVHGVGEDDVGAIFTGKGAIFIGDFVIGAFVGISGDGTVPSVGFVGLPQSRPIHRVGEGDLAGIFTGIGTNLIGAFVGICKYIDGEGFGVFFLSVGVEGLSQSKSSHFVGDGEEVGNIVGSDIGGEFSCRVGDGVGSKVPAHGTLFFFDFFSPL